MSLVQQNPWQDAANYGSGFASTLGQMFLGIPRQRYEMAMQRAQMPLQQQLLEAQIGALKAKPEIEKELADFRGQSLQNQKDRTTAETQHWNNEDSVKSLQEQVKELQFQLNSLTKGRPSISTDQSSAKNAVSDFASGLATSQGIDTKATPITPAPDVINDAINGAMQTGATNGSPYAGALQALVKLAPRLAPFLTTNQPPSVVSGAGPFGIGKLRGMYVTNTPPASVTTNGWSLAPSQPPQAPTPQPMQPSMTATNDAGQRIGLINGQWTLLQ